MNSNPNPEIPEANVSPVSFVTPIATQSGVPETETDETTSDSPIFSFEPIVLNESSTGPIGPGRPVDPAIAQYGNAVLDIFRNLSPNSRWTNDKGEPLGIPVPNNILSRPVLHRNTGTASIDKKVNARNFATRVTQYCQRALPEHLRKTIQIGVVPFITANGPIFTMAIRRFAVLPKR